MRFLGTSSQPGLTFHIYHLESPYINFEVMVCHVSVEK